MNLLLTGASGFIGGRVLARLLGRGARVASLGRTPPEIAGPGAERHRHLAVDLATGAGLDQVPWGEFDAVVHLAAAGVKARDRRWAQAIAVNVVGTQRLLDALSRSGATPRLFAARTFYERESAKHPDLLADAYIATKAASTELVRLFAATFRGGVVLGTLFQVYGPGDDEGAVLCHAAGEFAGGRVATFGSGRGRRDWIHRDDAASGVLAALEAGEPARVVEFDIGTGELRTVGEMVEALHRLFPGAPPPVFDPARDRPDLTLATAARNPPPGWRPEIPPAVGLRTLVPTP